MKVLTAINCLLSLASFPLLAAIMASSTWFVESHSSFMLANSGLTILITPLVAGAILLMTYVCALNAFEHLHNKSISDMHLSLPLTHKQRFWSSFSAGLSIVIVPYILSFIIGLFILLIFSDSKILVEVLGERVDVFIAMAAIPIWLTGLVVILMIYTLTTLCNALCGKSKTVRFFPFMLSAAIPLLIAALSSLAIVNARGIDSIGMFPYIISSPLGFFFGSITMAGIHQVFPAITPLYIIPTLLITAIMIVTAYYLIKNVKAENIGKDFLFKSIYNFQQAVICLCIVSFFGVSYITITDEMYAFLTLFVSFIAFFIGHVVHYKGLHKMKSGIIKYTAMLIASSLLCIILVAGKGFGAPNYVPPSFDIQGVRIQVSGSYGNEHTLVTSLDSSFFRHSWEFKRAEDYTSEQWRELTDEVRRLHRLVIDNPGINDSPINPLTDYRSRIYSRGYSITFEYELRSGLVVTRTYNYHANDINALVNAGLLQKSQGTQDI
jgi:hypothetical protein